MDVHLDQPVLLQVVHTVREEDSQQEVFRQSSQPEQGGTIHPICPIASSVQMQDVGLFMNFHTFLPFLSRLVEFMNPLMTGLMREIVMTSLHI